MVCIYRLIKCIKRHDHRPPLSEVGHHTITGQSLSNKINVKEIVGNCIVYLHQNSSE